MDATNQIPPRFTILTRRGLFGTAINQPKARFLKLFLKKKKRSSGPGDAAGGGAAGRVSLRKRWQNRAPHMGRRQLQPHLRVPTVVPIQR